MKKHTLKRIIALLCACALTFLGVIGSPVTARAEHREYPYDVDTEWTPDDVEEMIDYATQWVGKIDYASSQNNTDPGNRRHEELHSGGATDCSWFVFHVLYRFGLLNDFVHSYDWGNSPSCYPGAHNISNSISNAVPGDIICTGAGTKPQNSHVAIYIGNGQVVECCAGRGVVISDAPSHPRDIVHFSCIPTEYIDKGVDVE
ncbi:MAG: NlpC/P60 family protein [Lachnospiraceae bacterium]|jgi:cell wall-associated NlpC family hydrolase|nr:NlpC/P60 family protein [Lachnospiraceae bacterium]